MRMMDHDGSDAHVHTVTDFDPGTHAPRDADELLEGSAETVTAEIVHLEKSRAGRIAADRATVEQSAVQRLEAGSAQLEESAVAVAKSEDLAVHEGAVGALLAQEARVTESTIGLLRARHFTGGDGTRVLVQIGGAEGSSAPLLTGKTAMRLGASFALSVVVFGQLARRLFGR
jgi:hypothetical protein